MKKYIGLLFVLILSIFAFPIIAQEESKLSEIVLKQTYRDNWYISVGPSVNLLFGEQDKLAPFADRLKFGGEISVGKWFNPNVGISLNVMGGGLRGFNLTEPVGGTYFTGSDVHYPDHPMGGSFTEDNKGKYNIVSSRDGKEGFWQDFNYGVATIDLIGNMTNLFRGYSLGRNKYDFLGFVGLGANHTFSNWLTTPKFWGIAARAGLQANLNLTNLLGVYIKGVAYFTDGEFDGYKGTSMGDLYTNLSVGVRFTFNKRITSFDELAAIEELDHLNSRVNEGRSVLDNHRTIVERQQDILERQQALLDRLNGAPESASENGSERTGTGMLPEYVRFSLDSHELDENEYYKIGDIVEYMNRMPKAKVLLIGYADKLTGESGYNYQLSKQRAETIRDELRRSGIRNNRISVKWKGDREQPFSINEWNRVVLVIEQ
ncbi:MAG: OmpA family protein [Dysgonamonadaceae bacterium]|jgi:outer membrane protein OmpA-like peptidoglycan-associated protein|nr:OmpA family protein [Dysgonamonadaceae bacterium]